MSAEILTDYEIINFIKFNWYDTQAYKSSGDDNDGYIYGYVQWYGNQELDEALDHADDEVCWSWFKTEEERDLHLNQEMNNES